MRRAVLVLLAALVPGGLLAGCGGSADAQEVVARAGTEASEAGSARVVVTTTLEGLPTGGNISYDGTGVLDFERRRGQLTVDLGGLMPGFGGGDAGQLDLVYEGDVAYLRAPIVRQAFPDLNEWLRIDGAAAGEDGAGLGQLQQLAGRDPTQILAFLEGVADGSAREVGTDDVRDVETTHYRARIDLQRALEASGTDPDDPRVAALLEQADAEELDVDVWVDDQGRARRVSFTQPLPEGELASTMTTVVELFDFGIEAEIDLPDQSDTSDLSELTDRLGR